MRRAAWPVEDSDSRPAGKPGECFYCKVPTGGTHGPDCVLRTRTVVVELKIGLVMTMPESFDAGRIEFLLNESSSCQSNILNDLAALDGRIDCPCGLIAATYLREATEEDEERQRLFASPRPGEAPDGPDAEVPA